jgi:predicted NAD/FAD-dependent oxidoreductase
VVAGAKVVAVHDPNGRPTVELAPLGSTEARDSVTADRVILAPGGPGAVAGLLGSASASAAAWAESLAPVHMATLDLHLQRLPRPDRRACFALDAPIYLSTHTPSARLAESGEVVHVAWYGDAEDSTRAELEGLVDALQPGWRDQVIDARWSRSRVVMHGIPGPDTGFAGRPGPAVPDCTGVLVAGDWVGPRGLLADASIASGADAARLALR